MRHLESSRRHWKEKATVLKEKVTGLEVQLAEMELKERHLKTQLSKLKKNTENVKDLANKEPFNIIPARHTYDRRHIMLFLRLVLEASSSLRGASKSMEIVSTIGGPLESSPSWTCGRMWLLRLGYYKLTRPKQPGNDWIWIVDHTVQTGVIKCFTIFGIRQSHLPEPGHCLKYEHVEPIALLPVKKSNGQVVYEQRASQYSKNGGSHRNRRRFGFRFKIRY